MLKSRSFSSQHVLCINTGSTKKSFIYELAVQKGLRISFVHPTLNWGIEYAQHFVATDNKTFSTWFKELKNIHAQDPFDGIITFWEEDVPMAQRLSTLLGLPAPIQGSAWSCRSKFLMRKQLTQAGIPNPAFALVRSKKEALEALKRIGLPAILKPEFGADSEHVFRIDSPQNIIDAFTDITSKARVQEAVQNYPRKQPFILESYLTGPEVSVEGAVQNGKLTIYAIIDKSPMREPFFIEEGESTPSQLPRSRQQAIRKLLHQSVAALGVHNSGIHAEINHSDLTISH